MRFLELFVGYSINLPLRICVGGDWIASNVSIILIDRVSSIAYHLEKENRSSMNSPNPTRIDRYSNLIILRNSLAAVNREVSAIKTQRVSNSISNDVSSGISLRVI